LKTNNFGNVKKFFHQCYSQHEEAARLYITNVGGLAIGLTSFLFITLYVVHELSYDRFHKNYENIYGLKVVGRMAGAYLISSYCSSYGPGYAYDYPEVLHAARVTQLGAWLIVFGRTNSMRMEYSLQILHFSVFLISSY